MKLDADPSKRAVVDTGSLDWVRSLPLFLHQPGQQLRVFLQQAHSQPFHGFAFGFTRQRQFDRKIKDDTSRGTVT